MSANKFITMVLEVDGEEVATHKVRLQKKHMEQHRHSWYFRYALKNKNYKIYVKIPAKNEDSNRKYLTLNLNNLNFKPSNNESSTEQ